ncbi:MAG: peptidoglycan DD-metalloendopeptidase family protein [Vagococcus sp.]|uniref:glucosaminidase domain-containing protein n=1 Tax=Vagococcus sp. TaxID=1933889 RepID=UPI002FC8084A
MKKIYGVLALSLFFSATFPGLSFAISTEMSTTETSSTEESDTTEETTTSETSESDSDSTESSTTETTTSETNESTETTSTTEEITETTSTSSKEIETTTSSSSKESSTKDSQTTETTTQIKEKKKPKQNKKKNQSKKTSKPNKKKSVNVNYTVSLEDANFKATRNETNEQFIMKIGNKARKIAHKNDLYASVMIAQAALESGFGKSQLSTEPNHNLFGIKGAFQGKSTNMLTSEDTKSGYIQLVDQFRKYDSYDDSLKDYAKLMTKGINGNSSIYQGSSKKNSKTYQEATKKLTGVYATDRHYDAKLNAIIKAYDLTRFDKSFTEKVKHKVAKNDTLESIAKKYKVDKQSIIDLNKSLNNKKPLKVGTTLTIEKDIKFAKPLNQKYTVSSDFGSRGKEHHNGMDLAIKANTSVYATGKGVVEATGYDPSAGNYIIIKHDFGLYSSYFHLNEINVKKGQKIDMSQKIGLVGSTGNSTGPHLHFAISDDVWGNYYHPKEFVDLD